MSQGTSSGGDHHHHHHHHQSHQSHQSSDYNHQSHHHHHTSRYGNDDEQIDGEREDEFLELEASEDEIQLWIEAIEAQARAEEAQLDPQNHSSLEVPQAQGLLAIPRTTSTGSVNSSHSSVSENEVIAKPHSPLPEAEADFSPEVRRQLQRVATLKKTLYRIVLEQEGAMFEKEPEMIQNRGTLLHTCYSFVMSSPLLTKRGKTTAAKMRELILLLPTLNKQVKAGTKREIMKSLSDFFVGVFITLKKTTIEHLYADQLFSHLWDTAPEESPLANPLGPGGQGNDEEKKKREAAETVAKRRRLGRLRKTSALIMRDLEAHGGASRLISVLREAKTVKELPSPYLEYFETLKRLSAPGLPDMIEDPTKLEKLKALQARLPESVIVNIFRFTNPMKLVTSLSQLLLMNFLGGKSLLQRILLTLSDTHRTEKERNEVGANISPELRANILAFIEKNYPFDSEADYGVINRNLALAAMGPKYQNVGQDILNFCIRYFSLEIRRRQKADYIELIDSPQILSIMRHLFPVLQEPLMDMYRAGDIPAVIQIGESKKLDKSERLRQYREIVDELQDMLYSFLHGMAKKDKGSLHMLADWLIGSWMKADHLFELEAILAELSKEEQEELWEACDAITDHQIMGRSRQTTPQFEVVNKTASIFKTTCLKRSLSTESFSSALSSQSQ